MRGEPGFFDVDERLQAERPRRSIAGLRQVVDFELSRPELSKALAYSDGAQGGRPPFDPVMMFKILVVQAANTLSDERAEFLINDRLSFMRFLGLSLSDRVPDARTIWLFRERLTTAGAVKPLFERFDAALRAAGYGGARLRDGLLDKTNTASAVWADTAYRSKANEEFLVRNGFVSRIHRKKPPHRPMPETTRRANAIKSRVRSGVEHVFALQKDKMDLFIRTIGIARAAVKIRLANIVYSMGRLVLLDRFAAG
jgi:IS5 family transposase